MQKATRRLDAMWRLAAAVASEHCTHLVANGRIGAGPCLTTQGPGQGHVCLIAAVLARTAGTLPI